MKLKIEADKVIFILEEGDKMDVCVKTLTKALDLFIAPRYHSQHDEDTGKVEMGTKMHGNLNKIKFK